MENSYKEDAYNAFQLISNEDIDEFRIWTKEKCIASYDKLYRSTNEYLSRYLPSILEEGDKVLSVAASGDQYLSCIHGGAKEVDLFDINPLTYYYAMLKIVSATHLSYEDYIRFMTERNVKQTYKEYEPSLEKHYIKRLEKYLPENVNMFYEELYRMIASSGGYDIKDLFRNNSFKTDTNSVSFLSRKQYEILQSRLKYKPLPRFTLGDITQTLPHIKTKYDLILLSNIRLYSPSDFLDVIKKYGLRRLRKDGIIQADYTWNNATSTFNNSRYSRNVPEGYTQYYFPGETPSKTDGILLLKK